MRTYLLRVSDIDKSKLNTILSLDQRMNINSDLDEYGFQFKQFNLTDEELLVIKLIFPWCIPMLLK